ncbi:MAG: exosome complex exonuclease Rrp41 [Promethearchaeota archaeon]
MVLLIEEKKAEKLVDEAGFRTDGRKLDELRHLHVECGVIPNADGSAYIEHGGNKIYAAVYGPREVHPRHLARADRGILRVFYRMATYSVWERKSPAPNRREVEISKVVKDALEPVLFLEIYPNSALEVYIEVIAADGGTRCASTTVAALALADAGIPMRDLVCGVAAGKADGHIILDCNDVEDKQGEADMPCAVVGGDKGISLLQFDGDMTVEEIEKALELVYKGAKVINAMQHEALKRRYARIRDEVNPQLEQGEEAQAEGTEQPPEEREPVESVEETGGEQ